MDALPDGLQHGLCKRSFTMDLVIAHGPIRPIAPLGASAFPVCV